MKKIFIVIMGYLIIQMSLYSCSVDPTYYSEIVPDNFYQSQNNVWQRFFRPFTHLRWYMTEGSRWRLQELGTDEFCVPTRGNDWFSGGRYQQMHYHKFHEEMEFIYNGYYGFGLGAALAINTMDELSDLNLSKFDLSEEDGESIKAQLQTLIAFFYLNGLDLFGGVPLYKNNDSELKPRASSLETFQFVDSLLNIAIPKLPIKTELGKKENGTISRAAGAAIKARLYFNAASYIKEDRFADAAKICQDIIDGKYGQYSLDSDWTTTFGFNNEGSKEIIWNIPCDNTNAKVDGGFFTNSMPYNFSKYLGGLQNSSSNNGDCLIPSRGVNGHLYNYKLGGAYEKFADGDVRKQPYVYEGNGKYRGMFVVGTLINPLNNSWKCTGAREYSGQVLTIVDQITLFSKLGSSKYPDQSSLPSDMTSAEENSGVRLLKISPRPNQNEASQLFNPDIPLIRLSEIYYMLAECKMRLGDKQTAADLINLVRRRYFSNGLDTNPVIAASLDKYRMLDEWMQEFVGEGRRRTDLIRWNAYVTESWWDHQPSDDPNLNLFPIPARILASNKKLTQNPGY